MKLTGPFEGRLDAPNSNTRNANIHPEWDWNSRSQCFTRQRHYAHETERRLWTAYNEIFAEFFTIFFCISEIQGYN
jgi:hypothetical protein